MVREKRKIAPSVGFDLAGEDFVGPSVSKLPKGSRASSTENPASPNPGIGPQNTYPIPSGPPSAMCDPQPEQKTQPGSRQEAMCYPPPGIYQSGDRTLALLPVGPQGQPILPQQGCALYYPLWMYAQGINMNPWGRPAVQPFSADPPQFAPPKFTSPAEGMTAQTPIAVQYHICVSCKKPRSRKYQREHPLKPGESPAVAFCRKCQKDATSTEQSDDTEAYSRKKKHEDKKKRQNKDVVSLVSHLSLKS